MTQFRHVPDRNPSKKPIWIASQGDRIPMNEAAAEVINKSYEAAVPPPEPHRHAEKINPPPAGLPVQAATFERDVIAVANAQQRAEDLQALLDEKKQDIEDLKAKVAALENIPVTPVRYVILNEVVSVTREGDVATIKGKSLDDDTNVITIELPASAVREAVGAKKQAPRAASKKGKVVATE